MTADEMTTVNIESFFKIAQPLFNLKPKFYIRKQHQFPLSK